QYYSGFILFSQFYQSFPSIFQSDPTLQPFYNDRFDWVCGTLLFVQENQWINIILGSYCFVTFTSFFLLFFNRIQHCSLFTFIFFLGLFFFFSFTSFFPLSFNRIPHCSHFTMIVLTGSVGLLYLYKKPVDQYYSGFILFCHFYFSFPSNFQSDPTLQSFCNDR